MRYIWDWVICLMTHIACIVSGFPPRIWKKYSINFFLTLNTNFPDFYSEHKMIVTFFRWKSQQFLVSQWLAFKKKLPEFLEKQKVPWISLTTLFFQVFPDSETQTQTQKLFYSTLIIHNDFKNRHMWIITTFWGRETYVKINKIIAGTDATPLSMSVGNLSWITILFVHSCYL